MDIPVAPASKGVSSLLTLFLGFLSGGLIVGVLLLGTKNNSDAISSTALSDLSNGIFSLSDVDLAIVAPDFLDASNQNLEVDGFLRKNEASDLESLVFYFNNNPEYHSVSKVQHFRSCPSFRIYSIHSCTAMSDSSNSSATTTIPEKLPSICPSMTTRKV